MILLLAILPQGAQFKIELGARGVRDGMVNLNHLEIYDIQNLSRSKHIRKLDSIIKTKRPEVDIINHVFKYIKVLKFWIGVFI